MLKVCKTLLLVISLNSSWAMADNPQMPFSHAQWDLLLSEHVTLVIDAVASEVDYSGFAQDRDALQAYLADLAAVPSVDFDRWPHDEQLAFLINAYNAWTVELILSKYPKLESIRDLGNFFSSPWSKKIASLLGEPRSLDDIEHKMIRGSDRYNEPRIHFAVNCASVGCPALLPVAFSGANLDEQLESATAGFLADRSRNRLQAGRLQISSIFKWYRDDFVDPEDPASGLGGFLANFSDALSLDDKTSSALRAGELKIEFLDYDWTLNDRT